MEIKKKYYSKYLHEVAIEQIVEDYRQRGYTISREVSLGNYEADLLLTKDTEKIVIEVKTGKLSPDRKKQIAGLADYVRSLGNYKFKVVVATPPKEKNLQIHELDDILTSYIYHNFPNGLDELSTHTRPDEIKDIDIDEISISGTLISVKGDGVVSVELQFGSDGDQGNGDGFKTFDNFPFEFEITLEYNDDKELYLKAVEKFEVDTSSYYDNE